MNFYKDLFIWYFVAAFGGAFLLGVVISRMMPGGMEYAEFLIWLPVMLIWVVCCVFVYQLLLGKRLNQLARIRSEECRIQDFKNTWEGFQKQQHLFVTRQVKNRHEQTIKLNLSVAYLDLGETEKGLELLLSTPVEFPNNASGANYKITYYNNLAAIYLRLHNMEQAEQMLMQIKEVLEEPRLLKSSREAMEQAYQMKKVLLAMEQGNYEGAEAFFLECLEKENPRLTQVYSRYFLARVYQHFENKEKERECLAFVAENGGDSIYAQEAAKRLAFLKLQ